MDKSQLFWQTYLNLEKDFLDIAKYIYIADEVPVKNSATGTQFCNTQLDTFSPFIGDLLVRACIEIEAISKELYFQFGGEKDRGDNDLYFDEDCLKLIDTKCNTHKKAVLVSCPSFNLTKEENACFKPLKEAHKRKGTRWGKAYQALKHDRYFSIRQATIRNLIHAMGALFLLNIYCRKISLTSKFTEISTLDFSLGSSIFSVKQPDQQYVVSIMNGRDVTERLQADESPFVLKYTDRCYRKVLGAYQEMIDKINDYWQVQPELKEPEFIQQIERTMREEKSNPQCRCFPLIELGKYRLMKKVPASLPFDERKKLLISSPEWNGRIQQLNPRISAEELTEDNIQAEIEYVALHAGMDLQQQFEDIRMFQAFTEGYCELVLDTGDIRYKK